MQALVGWGVERHTENLYTQKRLPGRGRKEAVVRSLRSLRKEGAVKPRDIWEVLDMKERGQGKQPDHPRGKLG